MICPNSCVSDHVKEKYGAYGRYPREEEDALNIGIGSNNSVKIFLSTLLAHDIYWSTSLVFSSHVVIPSSWSQSFKIS